MDSYLISKSRYRRNNKSRSRKSRRTCRCGWCRPARPGRSGKNHHLTEDIEGRSAQVLLDSFFGDDDEICECDEMESEEDEMSKMIGEIGVGEEDFERMLIEHLAAEEQIQRDRASQALPLRFETAESKVDETSSDEEDWDVVSTGTADARADELREWEEVEWR